MGPVVSETPPVSLKLPPASVDKPFVPQFPGDVPPDATKLRDPGSYLQSLIAGEPKPQTQEEFLASLPGDDQVADASGGNNAFLDYILGTNNDDNYVPQFPGDVPLSLSDPATAAAIAEEKRLGIGGPDVIDSIGGRTDATISSLLGDAGTSLENASAGVRSGTVDFLNKYVLGDKTQLDQSNVNTIRQLKKDPATAAAIAEEERLGIGQNAANRRNIPQINPDFFEQGVAAAGNQLYTLAGGALRGVSETLNPTLPGQAPNFLSQVGANTAAEGAVSTQALLDDDKTGLGDRYRGGVTEVTGDNVGGIFNPTNYSRPIDPETGEKISFGDSFKNLGTKAMVTGIQAVPILASLPFSASAAILTGMGYGVGEVVNDASAELDAQRAAGHLTNAAGQPVTDAEFEQLQSDVIQNATALGSVSGAIETVLLPGFGKGIISRVLTGGGSGLITEAAQIEAANLASSDAMVPGTAEYDAFRTQNADELLTALVVGGTAPAFTPTMSTSTTAQDGAAASGIQTLGTGPTGTGPAGTGVVNTGPVSANPLEAFGGAGPTIDNVGRGQQTQEGKIADAQFSTIPTNPNVQITAPAQLAAPTGTQLTAPTVAAASNVISGTQTVPALPAPSKVDALPAFDISAVAQPDVTTNLEQITIPGTNVKVDVPKLAAPATDAAVNTQMPTGLASLGTGGVFNPNLATGSTVSAPAITNTATEAVSKEQAIIDIIATEVAQEGGLSAATATKLATDNNLSMVEVANLAENAMGVDASKATGPSTSLVPASSVALDTAGASNTGIATLDTTSSDVGGLVGEIMTDTDVGAATAPVDPAFDTIEGTVNSRSVVVPDPVATDTKGTVVTIPAAPVTTTTTEVVPQTQLVPSSYGDDGDDDDDDDDKGITVEVDEDVGDDDGGATIDLDPIDSDSDDGDGDELVPLEDDFECPDGYQKVMVKGQFVCQQIDSLPEKVRPTGGAYYQTNKNPEYGSRRRA